MRKQITAFCLLFCVLLSGCGEIRYGSDEGLTVHMLSVGNADCLLIKQGDAAMLIDAGTADYADKIVSYLHTQGVERLDYVLATHPHADHIGGMPRVIKAYDIGCYLYPEIPGELITQMPMHERLQEALDDSGASLVQTNDGCTFSLGEAQVTVLPCLEEYEAANDYSAVCRVDYREDSFLFMGDCEDAAEQALLKSGEDITADVIKLGHHGGKTASDRDFLSAVGAELALISCGADNDYNHPHRQTLDTLESLGIDAYRADIDGDVVITADGSGMITVQTEQRI